MAKLSLKCPFYQKQIEFTNVHLFPDPFSSVKNYYAESRKSLFRVLLFARTIFRLLCSYDLSASLLYEISKFLCKVPDKPHVFRSRIGSDVAICAKHLKGQSLYQQILHRLLLDLLYEKACKEHGFYLGITALKSVGSNKNNNDNDNDNDQAQVLTFPVSFTCRTFLPARGDILQGIVSRVLWNGVFIRSGPLRFAYLSSLKMPDYYYVSEGEKPYFERYDLSKIAVGVVVRFVVMAVRFKERPNKRRNDFYVLASMDGDDTLGPISLTGSDEPYM